jgi:hypothetical protein
VKRVLRSQRIGTLLGGKSVEYDGGNTYGFNFFHQHFGSQFKELIQPVIVPSAL